MEEGEGKGSPRSTAHSRCSWNWACSQLWPFPALLLCRDVGTVSQAGMSPSMSSLPLSCPFKGERKEMGPHLGCSHLCPHRHPDLVPPKSQPLLDNLEAPGPSHQMWWYVKEGQAVKPCKSGSDQKLQGPPIPQAFLGLSPRAAQAITQPEGASQSSLKPRGLWLCVCSHSWTLTTITFGSSDPPAGSGAGAPALKSDLRVCGLEYTV